MDNKENLIGTNFSIDLSEEERVAKLVVNAAFQVHKKLGPGLLEKSV